MPDRTTLLTALLITGSVLLVSPTYAQVVDSDDKSEAIQHIETLEQMMRDAGLKPPQRPEGLAEPVPPQPASVIPDTVDVGPFKKQARAINRRGKDAKAALQHVRSSLNHKDPTRAKAAGDIVFAVYRWAETKVKSADFELDRDPVAAYMIADDAMQLVGGDPASQVVQTFFKSMRSDRDDWRSIKSQAAYRRAMDQAHAIGLTGDWKLIDFGNSKVRDEIKRVSEALRLIDNAWPGSAGGELAEQTLSTWRKREAVAMANQPAWRYTYNLGLIWIGTERETSIITKTSGEVIIEQEERPTYDRKRVQVFGTFQNTSNKPYRYSFNVGVSTQFKLGLPFPGNTGVAAISQVHTPVLLPGEVYNWSVDLSVHNASDIRRVGLGGVEAHAVAAQQARD